MAATDDFVMDQPTVHSILSHTQQMLQNWAKSHELHKNDRIACHFVHFRSNMNGSGGSQSPVELVHIDFASDKVEETKKNLALAAQHLIERMPLLKRAIAQANQIYNVWIPVVEVIDDPLVMMSADTVTKENKVSYWTPFPVGDGQSEMKAWSYSIRYDPNQKVYYKSDMNVGDAIIFKTNGPPHCSAPKRSKSKQPRRTVEVRCFAYPMEDEANELGNK